MIKVTVLYGHPADPDAFEKHYFETHMPLVAKMPHVVKVETSRCLPGMDGGRPPYYRIAELYFETPESLQASVSSPEGQATTGDIPNYASGGVTFLMSMVDPV